MARASTPFPIFSLYDSKLLALSVQRTLATDFYSDFAFLDERLGIRGSLFGGNPFFISFCFDYGIVIGICAHLSDNRLCLL
jgi:hypothetical protein